MALNIHPEQLDSQLLNTDSPIIQWYPGHIAKAEKSLSRFINSVDLIVEVRDARVPSSSAYPKLKLWLKNKQHLLVINRRDMIGESAFNTWESWLRFQGEIPWWCDAKFGLGLKQLQKAITNSGNVFNERRKIRGMKPRPVRAIILGLPNVGKSALINRLVKQKIVASGRRAGVTRNLNWVRVSKEIDLLDSPGILPPRLDDQRGALLLAICDDIGEAAYNVESIAIGFLRILEQLSVIDETGFQLNTLCNRYGITVPIKSIGSVDWLKLAAEHHTSGNITRMSQRLLDDFRRSQLGRISLELPPSISANISIQKLKPV